MKKLLLIFLSLTMLLIVSCDSSSDSSVNPMDEGKVYLINGLGDFGTFSTIVDGVIENDVQNVGKSPNDIQINDGKVYVVNSGNSDVRYYNEEDLASMGAIQVTEGSNPSKCLVVDGKLYVSSLYGMGLEVYNLSDGQLITTIGLNGGKSGADVMALKDGFIYLNRNNYFFDKNGGHYLNEKILKIDTSSNTITDSVKVGVNVGDLLFDNSGKLHVLCSGNYGDIKGEINVVNPETMSVVHEINFDYQLSSLTKDNKGNIYTAKSDYDEAWNPESSIIKYHSMTYEVLVTAENSFFTTSSGVLDMHFDKDTGKLYIPLFNDNKVKVFENDTEIEEYQTGNGPQIVTSN